jgi:hypothetical protein
MNGPNQTISFEVDGEFYDRLTNRLFAALQGDPEDVIKFLLSQAMAAPEPAMRWMRERRLADLRPHEGHAPPQAKNVFEACSDAARERALQDNQAAISLVAAVRACCQ